MPNTITYCALENVFDHTVNLYKLFAPSLNAYLIRWSHTTLASKFMLNFEKLIQVFAFHITVCAFCCMLAIVLIMHNTCGILIAFPWQQRLHKCASTLCLHMHCLSCFCAVMHILWELDTNISEEPDLSIFKCDSIYCSQRFWFNN
jgi:hypothetical protein